MAGRERDQELVVIVSQLEREFGQWVDREALEREVLIAHAELRDSPQADQFLPVLTMRRSRDALRRLADPRWSQSA